MEQREPEGPVYSLHTPGLQFTKRNMNYSCDLEFVFLVRSAVVKFQTTGPAYLSSLPSPPPKTSH